MAGLIQGAAEEFAKRLAGVIRRFMRLKEWRDVERIAVGGGFRESRIGELVIGRASVILKSEGIAVTLDPIRNHPNEAGLIGSIQLAPPWMFSGHDSIVAVDIGGSNFRCGIVELCQDKAADLSAARVWKSRLWRHADEEPGRDKAVARLIRMIKAVVEAGGAKEAPPRALHRHRLSRHHRRRRLHRARRAEPARQLGERPLPPAGGRDGSDPRRSGTTKRSW